MLSALRPDVERGRLGLIMKALYSVHVSLMQVRSAPAGQRMRGEPTADFSALRKAGGPTRDTCCLSTMNTVARVTIIQVGLHRVR